MLRLQRLMPLAAPLAAIGILMLGPCLAHAQPAPSPRCNVKAAEATADTRDSALRAAYEVSLSAVDARMARAWAANRGKLGEAPGYHVSRLTTRCAPAGRLHRCYVEIKLC